MRMMEVRLSANIPEQAANYRPFERSPEIKLETYANACLETALEYSEDARQIYILIIQSYELPCCQVLIRDLVRCKQDIRDWLRARAKVIVKDAPQPDLPDSCKDVIAKLEGNTDFHELYRLIDGLIMFGFNRKIDLDNHMPKVIYSPYLTQAITFYSLLDYLQIRPDVGRGPRVIPDSELNEFSWFCRTLASDPTTREDRKVRRMIARTARKNGFKLHHNQTILDGAEMWYRARVLCNTAREAADYYHIDAIDLSKRIEPYDDATGWPRHR